MSTATSEAVRTIKVGRLTPGDVMVGESGGRSVVSGDVYKSATMPGFLAIECEHGTLYLDPDDDVQVVNRHYDIGVSEHGAKAYILYANCNCGWGGPPRRTLAMTVHDLADHIIQVEAGV